ncbi:protein KRI1 [Pelomyxa schiedti]|nr:protein KRI1 [Pelomyxa schiedti]
MKARVSRPDVRQQASSGEKGDQSKDLDSPPPTATPVVVKTNVLSLWESALNDGASPAKKSASAGGATATPGKSDAENDGSGGDDREEDEDEDGEEEDDDEDDDDDDVVEYSGAEDLTDEDEDYADEDDFEQVGGVDEPISWHEQFLRVLPAIQENADSVLKNAPFPKASLTDIRRIRRRSEAPDFMKTKDLDERITWGALVNTKKEKKKKGFVEPVAPEPEPPADLEKDSEAQEKIKNEFLKAAEEVAAGSTLNPLEKTESGTNDDFVAVRQKTEAELAEEEEKFIRWKKDHPEVIGKLGEKATFQPVVIAEDLLQKFWNESTVDPDEKFLRSYIFNRMWEENGTQGIVPSANKKAGAPGVLPSSCSCFDTTGSGPASSVTGITQTDVDEVDEEEIEKGAAFEEEYNFGLSDYGKTSTKKSCKRITWETTTSQTDETTTPEISAPKPATEIKKEEADSTADEPPPVTIIAPPTKLSYLGGSGDAPDVRSGTLDEERLSQQIQFYPRNLPSMRRKDLDKQRKKEAHKLKEIEKKEEMAAKLKKEKMIQKGKITKAVNEVRDRCGLAAADWVEVEELLDSGWDADAYDKLMGKILNKGDEEKSGDEEQEEIQNHKAAMLENEEAEIRALLAKWHDMEYEDKVSGVPFRFHYTEVPKCSYGLTPEQILAMEDEDLQEVVPLRAIAPYVTRDPVAEAQMYQGAHFKAAKAGLAEETSSDADFQKRLESGTLKPVLDVLWRNDPETRKRRRQIAAEFARQGLAPPKRRREISTGTTRSIKLESETGPTQDTTPNVEEVAKGLETGWDEYLNYAESAPTPSRKHEMFQPTTQPHTEQQPSSSFTTGRGRGRGRGGFGPRQPYNTYSNSNTTTTGSPTPVINAQWGTYYKKTKEGNANSRDPFRASPFSGMGGGKSATAPALPRPQQPAPSQQQPHRPARYMPPPSNLNTFNKKKRPGYSPGSSATTTTSGITARRSISQFGRM